MAVSKSPHQQTDLKVVVEPERSMFVNRTNRTNRTMVASSLNGSKLDLRVFISLFPWR